MSLLRHLVRLVGRPLRGRVPLKRFVMSHYVRVLGQQTIVQRCESEEEERTESMRTELLSM